MTLSPALVSAFFGLLLLQAAALILSLAYSRRKHRHLFLRLNALKGELSQVEQERLSRLEPLVEKLSALQEIQTKMASRSGSGISPRFVAQYSEDLLLYWFFKDEAPGFFVEAGAYDGVFASNTYLLESIGWRGLLVEPHPAMATECRRSRPNSFVVEAALGPADAEGEVEFTCANDPGGGAILSFLHSDDAHVARCQDEQCELLTIRVPYCSLNSLLSPHTSSIDLLSLDVEGMELSVLKGVDLERYRPSIILVERQGDERDQEVEGHLLRFSYHLAAVRACNAYFVENSAKDRFEKCLRKSSNWFNDW